MKEVKTRPRFRCDYCRKTGTKESVARHEQICWKNPNRWCPTCSNTGELREWIGDAHAYQVYPCPYCSKRLPELSERRFVVGFLGEDHPLPVVHDGELWPDAEEVKGGGESDTVV